MKPDSFWIDGDNSAVEKVKEMDRITQFEKWKKSIKSTPKFFRLSESFQTLYVLMAAGFYCPECGYILEPDNILTPWGIEITRRCTKCSYWDWFLENRADE